MEFHLAIVVRLAQERLFVQGEKLDWDTNGESFRMQSNL